MNIFKTAVSEFAGYRLAIFRILGVEDEVVRQLVEDTTPIKTVGEQFRFHFGILNIIKVASMHYTRCDRNDDIKPVVVICYSTYI